ncbi:MAG: hypothetical protein ACTHLY_05090 [Pseudolabrys sp.]
MLMVRYLVAGGVAVVLSAATAAAQVYAPAPGYPVGYVPPPPQVQGFNRVIVTDAPMPPNLGRPYPYAGGAQPGVLVMPYHPAYAPPPRYRARKAARHVAPAAQSRRAHSKSAKAPSRELITELKKKHPRIKQIAVEDATGTIPAAPPRHRAASAGSDKDVRVIHAEAEVKIIGNDQMSIRLYRKRGTAQAKASANAD